MNDCPPLLTDTLCDDNTTVSSEPAMISVCVCVCVCVWGGVNIVLS